VVHFFYLEYSQFKKIVLALIASKLSDVDFENQGIVFNNIDNNKDGLLTVEEIEKGSI
jgi:hypothetical protein